MHGRAIEQAAAPADDPAAAKLTERNALIATHQLWARRIAKAVYLRLRVRPLDWSDYVQAATIGLIEAASRFDPSHGVDFRAFAIRRVRGEVFNSLRLFLRAPSNPLPSSMLEERAESLDSEDSDPLARMVELVSGLGAGLLLELESIPVEQSSAVDAYNALETAQLQQLVSAAVEQLPERERYIVSMHYLHHVPFVDIAESLALTKGRVSQLHKRAIERLRDVIRADAL